VPEETAGACAKPFSELQHSVTDVSKRELATGSFFAGVLLLLCALAFYYFAVLKIDYQKTTLLDLGPYPDATEYFAQARALLKDRWPSIQIGYDKLPSRYPPGYPALMLPWLKILPEAQSVLAPFRTNQTLGLLLLLTVFGFYAYLAMPLTGGVAALLLATLPGFFIFCRSSLSEISASALIVFAFMFAYLGLKEERRWKIYLSAVFLGLSLNVRIQSLFFAPLLLAMALFPIREMRWRWFLHCAALPVVFVLGASPLLMLNTIQFHSPFKTGYDFWTPYFTEHHLNSAVARILRCRYFWYRHILCSFLYSSGLHRAVFYPAQLVRWLRLSGGVELFRGDVELSICQRWTLLPAALNPFSRARCPAGDWGRKDAFCWKADYCRPGHPCLICRGMSRLSLAFQL